MIQTAEKSRRKQCFLEYHNKAERCFLKLGVDMEPNLVFKRWTEIMQSQALSLSCIDKGCFSL